MARFELRKLLIWTVALVGCLGPAFAVDPIKYQVSPEDVPKFNKPIAIYSAGEVSYFTGDYRTAWTIPLPPARGNLVPNVSLEYSSGSALSSIGRGWDVSLAYIRRSLRSGVPRYVGLSGSDRDDEIEFRLGGTSGHLVYVRDEQGRLLYRPKRESLFAKFYYDPGDDSWVVYERNGIKHALGLRGAKDQDGARVYGWHVKLVDDPDGNRIEYSYLPVIDGVLRVKSITYDLHVTRKLEHTPSVHFLWETNRSPQQISYKRGYRTVWDAMRLGEIQVVGYDEDDQIAEPHRIMIQYRQDDPSGLDGEIHRISAESSFAEFSYHESPAEFDRAETIADSVRFPEGDDRYNISVIREHNKPHLGPIIRRTTSMLLDMDGDRDRDMLAVRSSLDDPLVKQNYWHWRENRGGKWATQNRSINIPSGLEKWTTAREGVFAPGPQGLRIEKDYESHSIRVQDILDIDGDGVPDLVVSRAVPRPNDKTLIGLVEVFRGVAPGTGGSAQFRFEDKSTRWGISDLQQESDTPLAQDTEHGRLGRSVLGNELGYDTTAIIDMNGDGLLDYVHQPFHGDGRVYFNSGERFESVPVKFDFGSISEFGSRTKPALRSYTHADNGNEMHRDLKDMNGDGLADLIVRQMHQKGFSVYHNTGSSFDWKHPVHVNGGSISSNRGFPGQKVKYEIAGLYDVNGDRLPDFLAFEFKPDQELQRWVVRLNTGRGFGAPKTWRLHQKSGVDEPWECLRQTTGPFDARQFYSKAGADQYIAVNQALLDFDGDGQLELVTSSTRRKFTKYVKTASGRTPWRLEGQGSSWLDLGLGPRIWPPLSTKLTPSERESRRRDLLSDVYSPWSLHGTLAKPVHKLSKVVSSNGAKARLTYAHPAEDESRVPFPLWTVSKVERDDIGLKTAYVPWGPRTAVDYIYSYNPSYDHALKEFRGFARVKLDEEAHNSAGKTFRKTTRYFHQDEFKQGAVYKTEIEDGNRKVKEINSTFETIPFDTKKRAWTRLERRTTASDSQANRRELTERYSYYDDDAERTHLGLLRKIVREGDPDEPSDRRIEEFDYFFEESTHEYIVRKKSQTRKDSRGGKVAETQWQYDGMCATPPSHQLTNGRMCSESVWRGDAHPPAVTRYEYDTLGRTIAMTDPDGVKIQHAYHADRPYVKRTYNTLGHSTYFSWYDALNGKPRRQCGPQYLTKPETDKCDVTRYDVYGRPIRIEKALDDGQGEFDTKLVSRFRYHDIAGAGIPPHVTAEHFPNGFSQDAQSRKEIAYFDSASRIVMYGKSHPEGWSNRYFRYDEWGRLAYAWFPRLQKSNAYDPPEVGPHDGGFLTGDFVYDHDALDRLVRQVGPRGDDVKAKYTGRTIIATDPRGNDTVFTRNIFGDITSAERVIGTERIRSEFQYDAAGRVVNAIDPDGGEYDYRYYGDGQLRGAKLPSGAFWECVRAPSGKITEARQGNGAKVVYRHDEIGRLKERVVTPGSGAGFTNRSKTEQFKYSAEPTQLGYLNRVNSDHYRLTFRYDALGDLAFKSLEESPQSATGPHRKISYGKTFNALSELTAISYPSGRTVQMHYDVGGRLSNLEDSVGSLTAAFTYEPNGQPRRVAGSMKAVHGQSLEFARTYSYDFKNRLRDITSDINGTPWKISYQYDKNDNVIDVVDNWRRLNCQFSYDSVNRLTSAQEVSRRLYNRSFTYHKNSALKKVDSAGAAQHYVYTDGTNHVLKGIRDRQRVTQYATDSSTGNRIRSCVEQQIAQEYAWTGDGLLATVEQEPDDHSEFEYHFNGSRWKRSHNDSTTLFLDDLVELDEATGTVLEYIDLPGIKCRLRTNVKGQCLFLDRMNVVVGFDDQGSVIQSVAYGPYGGMFSLDGQDTLVFDFNGKRRETGDGLSFYGARYYDSESRQFVSADPLRFSGVEDVFITPNALQPYVYAGGNPVTFAEVNGEFPWVLLPIIIFAVQELKSDHATSETPAESVRKAISLAMGAFIGGAGPPSMGMRYALSGGGSGAVAVAKEHAQRSLAGSVATTALLAASPNGTSGDEQNAARSAARISRNVDYRFRCRDFAARLKRALRRKGISGTLWRLDVQRNRIFDIRSATGTFYGEDVHEAIQVGDRIFDSMNCRGIPFSEWRNSLRISRHEGLIPERFFTPNPF